MTLRELKSQVRKTEGVNLPTAKELHESNFAVVLQESFETGSITAYENGFAIYECSGNETVLRIDKCKDYTYQFNDGTTSYCGEEVFIDSNCTALLLLIGEARLEHNMQEKEAKSGLVQLPEEESIEDVPDTSLDFVTEIENAEKCRYALSCLNEKQRQAIILYYFEGLSMPEIAAMLGVTKQTISIRIQNSLEKMKFFMNQC